MSVKRPRKRLQAAQSYLSELIRTCILSGNTKLPSVLEMAENSAISPVTIRKALDRYEKHGIIQRIPRKGTFVKLGNEPRSPVSCEPASKSEWIASQLREEMLCSSRHWDVPSTKALMLRFGAASRTVQRALHLLSARGYIAPYKRGYRQQIRHAGSNPSTIILVSYARKTGVAYHGGTWFSESILLLEQTVRRANMNLAFLPFDYRTSQRSPTGLGTTPEHKKLLKSVPAGVVLKSASIRDWACKRILDFYNELKVPVAVIDETGVDSIGEVCKGRPATAYLDIGWGAAPGEHVGRYLRQRGHRRCLFFGSDSPKAPASRNRIEGLRRAFVSSDPAVGLQVIDMPAVEDIPADARSRVIDATVEQCRKEGLDLSTRLRRRFFEHNRAFFDSQGRIESSYAMFRAALKDSPGTAWVTYNDELGILARSFLEDNTVRLPSELSLVSFDNTIGSLSYDISSYQFSVRECVQTAFNFVLSPKRFVSDGTYARTFDGMVIERESSGRAPRSS